MSPDPLPDAGTLAERLGVRVVIRDVVGSTMESAAEDAGAIPAIHLAERQTEGRGRHGRRWESPAGNLHATIAWPDPEGAIPPAILAATQLAWSRAVERAGGPRTACKWPNDGMLEGRKWAGALAVRSSGETGGRLLVGLGANLTAAPETGPGGAPAIALAERWRPWPGRARIVPLLLEAAVDVLRAGPRAVPDAIAGWDRRDALRRGDAVAVETAEGVRRGVYGGVAPDGRLRLEADGATALLAAGDVTRLRPGA